MHHLRDIIWPVFAALILVALVSLRPAVGQVKTPPGKNAAEKKTDDKKTDDNKPTTELTAESDTGTKAEEKDTILTMIRESDWSGWIFMGVLGLFSFIAATIVIERLVNLTRGKVIPQPFADDLRRLLDKAKKEEVQLGEFHDLSKRSTAPMTLVFQAALTRAGRPVPEVVKAMEDTMSREVAVLRSRVLPLSIIGNITPLIGLLGTVVGMILAFYNVTTANARLGGKAEVLAQGIYLALLTTAAGLTIAIPSLLFAAYFRARIDNYVREMDQRLMEALPYFDRMEAAPSGAPAGQVGYHTDQLVGTK